MQKSQGRRAAGRPRRLATQGEPLSSRERLIRVAIELFSHHGFEPVTTGQIAAAAGLTQSMVHYHFQSKANLWKTAIDTLMRERGAFLPATRLSLRDIDPLARLKVLTRRFIMASAADPHIARIGMHESMQQTARLQWLVERYIGTTYRLFDSSVREAIEQGFIKPLPVSDITNLILTASAIPFTAQAWVQALYGYSVLDAERIESYSNTLMAVIFSGLEV